MEHIDRNVQHDAKLRLNDVAATRYDGAVQQDLKNCTRRRVHALLSQRRLKTQYGQLKNGTATVNEPEPSTGTSNKTWSIQCSPAQHAVTHTLIKTRSGNSSTSRANAHHSFIKGE
jgi:hypothetical protein